MASLPVRIAPSILSADFARLGEQVLEAEAAGADLLHVDVMDGHFVPNISVGPLVVRALAPLLHIPIHAHLMIEHPDRYIEAFAEAGADLITVHVETCPDLSGTLARIRACGALPAVTLNPDTPLSALEPVLDRVSLVLVMTVNPGFGGQAMLPGALDRVRAMRKMLDSRGLNGCAVEVDGGVNAGTVPAVLAAGADTLVMGSAVFANGTGVREAMASLRAVIDQAKRPLP